MNSVPAFDALGFTFTISGAEPRVANYLHGLFAALRTSCPPQHAYYLTAIRSGRRATAALLLDGQDVGEASEPEALIRAVVRDVNQRVGTESGLLTIHAAASEHAGTAILLPGSMEVGKTTLVAGLVRAGFGYLTDETVGIDFASAMAHPYPKPLSLDPGSWPLFPELEPHAPFATSSYKADQWQVAPDSIRPGSSAGPCPVRLVVFPWYEVGANTQLVPLRRAEAVIELAKCTFGFRDLGPTGLDLIADVVRGAECYRLPMGNLERAVELLSTLVGAGRAGQHVP